MGQLRWYSSKLFQYSLTMDINGRHFLAAKVRFGSLVIPHLSLIKGYLSPDTKISLVANLTQGEESDEEYNIFRKYKRFGHGAEPRRWSQLPILRHWPAFPCIRYPSSVVNARDYYEWISKVNFACGLWVAGYFSSQVCQESPALQASSVVHPSTTVNEPDLYQEVHGARFVLRW